MVMMEKLQLDKTFFIRQLSWCCCYRSDLVTFVATGALNPNDDTDKAGPALTLDADGDLETVTLDGTFTTVTLSNNGNLTVTIGGTVTGAGGVNIS